MNIKKETYRKYLEMGWSVIPWKLSEGPDGKIIKSPAISSWREYQTRYAMPDELEEWDNKYNGVAVITGEISNISVVDVDTDNESDLPFEKLDSEMVVESISGGHHYYFLYDENTRTTSKLDNLPIDVRSDGGLIILPPSNFKQKKYSFVKEAPAFTLPKFPKDVSEVLKVRKQELSTPVGNNLPEAFEGNRNEMATRVIGSLFARLPSEMFGLSDELLFPAFLSWNQNKCHPSLPERELETIYQSIKQIHSINHPELILTPNDFGMPRKLNSIADERTKEHLLELTAPRTGINGLDQIIKGFLPGHVYTITGETNVGKTSLCCNFAYSVAKQKRRVLYFALEPGNTIVDYLASVKEKATFDDSRDKIFDISEEIDVYTEGINNIDSLKNTIDVLEHYDLVIIDHISYFITGSDNYIQEQSNAIKEIAKIAKTKKIAIMLVAHINKKASMSGKIDFNAISGSAAFKQDSTEVLIVTREKDDESSGTINVVKTKSGPNGVCPVRFKENSALINEEGSF
jgi:archaellum biogenesis ATPase FlaH